ncbi:MAG TPA: TonB-dependent receptor [Allosphingosinicella sp.]
MIASRLWLFSSISAFACVSAPAFAQDAPPAEAPAGNTASAQGSTPSDGTTVPPEDSVTSASTAVSEDAAPASEESGDILVTGTRLNISGYRQPTPVTVVDSERLVRDSHTDISSVIAQLPSAGAMSSPNTSNGSQSVSGGSAGLSLVNLRNLGADRSLVLFDGRRVVASGAGGGTDLNLLPQGLVQRIDVVTGGASAAWGSDAVAGVVNIILNKGFKGWAAHVEGATNQKGTRRTAKAELSFGTDLFGNKGRLILSGAYLYSPDHVVPQETSWYKAQNLVNNPAWTATNGQPRLIHSDYVGLSSMTQGGLITGGPLRGIQFVGPNGTPAPFDFGNVSGTLSNGGTFVNPVFNGQANSLAIPIKTATLFAHFAYDITDDITATFELNWGNTKTKNGSASYTRQGNINIQRDNAYLDETIRQRMFDLGITSFPFGTSNSNNQDENDEGLDPNGLGNLFDEVERTMFRQVFALDGKLGGGWTWDFDLQHSKHKRWTHLVVDPVIANYNRAIDAVRVTAANRGTSNLPLGSIVCRSTLTAPTNGCQPLNLFGIGVASPDAIAYINSGPAESDLILEQYTAGFSIKGEPFSTWAGPVAVAAGAEYRKESATQTADPLSYARGYAAGNFQPFDVSDYVYEGFAEVNVPLLADSVVDSLDVNAAGRVTNYSSSGRVVTWKFGLTSQLTPDVRLRGTASSDIRAPSLTELYNPGSTSIQVVNDPFRPGNPTTNIFALGGGNPNLKPEVARTYSAGIVLTPRFIRGLNVSIDWYSINIKGAIASPGYPYVLAQCFAGVQIFCPFIQRDANGVITIIATSPVNAASNKTSGVDFQMDYRRPIFNGHLGLSLIGGYTHELTIDSLGVVVRQAGSLNRAPPNTGTAGAPKLRLVFAASYTEDRFSLGAQARAFGKAKLNNAWTEGVDVDENDVPAIAFVDLRASYYLDAAHNFQIYAAVDNVLNQEPPIIPHGPLAGIPYFYTPTRTDIYDALGRSWRFGVRAKF